MAGAPQTGNHRGSSGSMGRSAPTALRTCSSSAVSRSRPPLLPTLETYLAHAGRKAETARELHLNRQTLYNRLARIGELLGTDLDDPQTVLALSLALRARRYVP